MKRLYFRALAFKKGSTSGRLGPVGLTIARNICDNYMVTDSHITTKDNHSTTSLWSFNADQELLN